MIGQNQGVGLSKKVNTFFEDAVNQMLSTAGYSVTYTQAKRKNPERWWRQYSITRANKATFKAWFLAEYQSRFVADETRALQEYLIFDNKYGLKQR